MMISSLIIFYGLLVLVGGVIGFKTAGSKASLISGSIFGVLLIANGVLTIQGVTVGVYIALGIAAFLAAFFGVRLVKTKKLMPSGLMLILSIIVSLVIALSLA
jgi:uncharacterized membrane protein (UPF0136 family)